MDTLRLAEQVEGALSGPAWHGASLEENLKGLTPELRPRARCPRRHSMWELVLHITAWAGEVTRRLAGAEPAMPAEGDWPPVAAVSPRSWSETLERLGKAHAALVDAVRRHPAERWTQRVGGERDAPLGTGVTYAEMVQGCCSTTPITADRSDCSGKRWGAPPAA